MGCESEVVFECKMGPTDKEAQSGRLPQLYICDGFVYLFFEKDIFIFKKDIQPFILGIELAVPQSCLVPSSATLLYDHSRKIQSKQ